MLLCASHRAVTLGVIAPLHDYLKKRAWVGSYVALYERENRKDNGRSTAETDPNATNAFRQLLCKGV